MREITDVITQLEEVLPADDQLRSELNSIRGSRPYTAPEAIGLLWVRLQKALQSRFPSGGNSQDPEDELIQKTLKIFNGT